MSRKFGEIAGVTIGDLFESRKALNEVGLHRPLQAGISGSQNEGADSIVLSGGYIDDEDYGDEIIYTGEGGRDPQTGLQTSDQELVKGNKALVISFEENLPIRVIRGYQHNSPFSPKLGYRYDGLYRVTNYWQEKGRNGYKIWRFNLERTDLNSLKINLETSKISSIPERVISTITRIVRDSAKVSRVKKMYNNQCQVCGITIKTPAGTYSEGAHIKPLGKPHNGIDDESNILCLCPNHHKMLDYHSFTMNDDFSLVGIVGKLTVNKKHYLNKEFLKYHRNHFYTNSTS